MKNNIYYGCWYPFALIHMPDRYNINKKHRKKSRTSKVYEYLCSNGKIVSQLDCVDRRYQHVRICVVFDIFFILGESEGKSISL